MDNNTRQLNTITPQQAKTLRRIKYGLDIVSGIFFLLCIGTVMYIIPAVTKSEEGVSTLVIGICQAAIALSFLSAVVCGILANSIDGSYGAYYCRKCKQIHFPDKKVVEQSDSFLQYGLLRCPHCKKLSWNKKVIPME